MIQTIFHKNISIQNRPQYWGLFYNISLREKNGVKLTKVNKFSYNTLTINDFLNNNIFQLMVFPPFSGLLRQLLTTLSDSGLNETIEKKINTELILPSPTETFGNDCNEIMEKTSDTQPGSTVALSQYRSVNRGISGIMHSAPFLCYFLFAEKESKRRLEIVMWPTNLMKQKREIKDQNLPQCITTHRQLSTVKL